MFESIKPIDPVAERRRRRGIAVLAFAIMMTGYLYYEFKNYPEERQVSRFFNALQQQNFEQAYRIWQPTPYYTYKDFLQDWGRDGIEGPVNQFHITGSTAEGSGVVVRVMVNNKETPPIWVETKDKSLSFPP